MIKNSKIICMKISIQKSCFLATKKSLILPHKFVSVNGSIYVNVISHLMNAKMMISYRGVLWSRRRFKLFLVNRWWSSSSRTYELTSWLAYINTLKCIVSGYFSNKQQKIVKQNYATMTYFEGQNHVMLETIRWRNISLKNL